MKIIELSNKEAELVADILRVAYEEDDKAASFYDAIIAAGAQMYFDVNDRDEARESADLLEDIIARLTK